MTVFLPSTSAPSCPDTTDHAAPSNHQQQPEQPPPPPDRGFPDGVRRYKSGGLFRPRPPSLELPQKESDCKDERLLSRLILSTHKGEGRSNQFAKCMY